MPRLLDTAARTETVAAAINHLMTVGGASALTLRAIATECRLSPASLSLHYGSREHLLRVAADVTSRARTARMQERARRSGVLAFLPEQEDEVVDARAWLGWCELWRSGLPVDDIMSLARAEDEVLLAVTHEHRLQRSALDTLLATTDGLLVALCSPHDPLGLPTAHSLLRALSDDLLSRSPA